MRKIYLTININVRDKCFDELTNFKKANVGELVQQRILEPFELEEIRAEIVAEAILESDKDFLIGAAINSSQELKKIVETIRGDKLSISRIYYEKGKRRKASIEKYKKAYSQHSRWLDYPPEHIEQRYLEFDKKVEEIKECAIENEIKLIAI